MGPWDKMKKKGLREMGKEGEKNKGEEMKNIGNTK